MNPTFEQMCGVLADGVAMLAHMMRHG